MLGRFVVIIMLIGEVRCIIIHLVTHVMFRVIIVGIRDASFVALCFGAVAMRMSSL